MKQQTLVILKSFIAQSSHPEELTRFLPSEVIETMGKFEPGQAFRPKTFLSSTGWTSTIHFSWFTDKITNYPVAIQPFFLGLLSQPQIDSIVAMLPSSPSFIPRKPSSFLRPFLSQLLRSEMMESDVLAIQHLPTTPLNVLLHLERKELYHLAHLLGLHDLAADLRQVVDKALLGKMHQALSQEQLQFLSYCTKLPMKWVSPKMGLLSWDGSKKQLNHLLHYRGLLRLAKGVIKEDSSFKWHLLHRLDIGRAKIIQKELYKKQDLSLVSYFKNQVLHIIKRARSQNDT